MAMPLRVPMKISLLPSETWTAMTASPSSTSMAMMPPARGLLNADSSVFFTSPRWVPMTMNLLSSNSLHGQQRRDAFALLHRHQVGDRLAAAVRTDVGNLVHLQPVGAAAVRENHDVGVRRGHEQVADEVLFAGPHADPALAAAALVPVVGDRGALDVAGVGHRDRHVFLGDQVASAELAGLGQDFGATVIAVLLDDVRAARRR